MAKDEKTMIDKDLEKLYKNASKCKIECPECHKTFEHGGDFSEMARAMQLRIDYEKVKKGKDGVRTPSFFTPQEEQ